jgi:hypothetical protein
MIRMAWLDRHPIRKTIVRVLYRLIDYLTKCSHERLSKIMIGQNFSWGEVINEWAYKICLDCGTEILQPYELPDFVRGNQEELKGLC